MELFPAAGPSDAVWSCCGKVGASDVESCTVSPFSLTKSRRGRFGIDPRDSERMSPRREILWAELLGIDRDERTKSPLLLLGMSALRSRVVIGTRVGLELEA
jgi:hypothetical protein